MEYHVLVVTIENKFHLLNFIHAEDHPKASNYLLQRTEIKKTIFLAANFVSIQDCLLSEYTGFQDLKKSVVPFNKNIFVEL